ncbi:MULTISPECIES: FAD-dependent monooxygenase [Streptomyces]|uniref:2-polyprenyl-6-methoxyphenol hydroxylase-like FAD-dependent oxidoreductase n=2 Tax=Streptomyces TaxID=1883 RepID=A0ABT9LD43_STRGD|nr:MULTISPECIES: FAD-dependent monooxygenase [Streptomyces]MDP9681638.1 2-polyprenyl-6-methoxyphenol hydroxylase-like FAD-dependent oxidoreductase [Streptomyces griseoviridis]GGS73136.1 oxidoreductase [Streptomyces griseoviridis]GGU43395.1 oxidoreductase [Streptomyces daghestanicus]GHI34365.1 oxidoreductase [Streptomyces daghestanicus]
MSIRTNRSTGGAARRTVLVSGASIAGPAVAFWLRRYGFEVTVVEKAAGLRGGGYPIDVRGDAVEVVRRMGILPRLRDAHLASRRLTFLDADGTAVAAVAPRAVGGGTDEDVEVPRGELVRALYEAVRDDVEFVFGDCAETLTDHAHGVDVTFRSGVRRGFDLVLGADGMHSGTRELVFGPEPPFRRHLGYCFALFALPNTLALSHEVLVWNTPGRAAALYAAGDSAALHALLAFAHPEPPAEALRDPAAGRDLVTAAFAGAGWEIPAMVDALRRADDPFFDTVSQIRMPGWSRGRVALLGDAAHAPSFLTGQGTSLALIGAQALAASLAARTGHRAAFAAYEGGLRGLVERTQARVDAGGSALFPATAEALARRNERLRRTATAP